MARFHDLPFEILDMIIHHALISRGITRALRLKLVCSKWLLPSVQLLPVLCLVQQRSAQ